MAKVVVPRTPIKGQSFAGPAAWRAPVESASQTAPPGSPGVGDRYIVASVATGAWAGHEDDIATWDGGSWDFETPLPGWVVWVKDVAELYIFDGIGWNQESFGPHAVTHQNAGSDEIDVSGLSGTLADPQTPSAHAPSHKGGGSDAIDVATASVDGLMSAADKARLDLVPTEANVSTTDATQTTIATVPIPDDTAILLIADVVGRRTNGVGRACYIRRVLVYREAAGAPSFQGTINTEFTRESLTLWDATFVISGNNVLIQVQGRAGDDVNWNCRYTAQERG